MINLYQLKKYQYTLDELKYHVVSVPVLEIYDNNDDTWVEVHNDAKEKALSSVLLQKYKTAKHIPPIVCYSKNLKNT